MNSNKLVSILQSRIAKRKVYIKSAWQLYSEIKAREEHYQAHHWKVAINNVGEQQKQDKQIMKALIEAQRKHAHHVDTCWRLTHEVLKLREQLKHYKLTGHPLVKGNAN